MIEVEQRLWTPESGWQPGLDGAGLGARANLVLLFGSVERSRQSECLERARACYPNALSVNEPEQSITYAGNVPEGTQARFMFATIDDLIGGSQQAASSSRERLGARPELSLLVSCNGRRYVLKQRTAARSSTTRP